MVIKSLAGIGKMLALMVGKILIPVKSVSIIGKIPRSTFKPQVSAILW